MLRRGAGKARLGGGPLTTGLTWPPGAGGPPALLQPLQSYPGLTHKMPLPSPPLISHLSSTFSSFRLRDSRTCARKPPLGLSFWRSRLGSCSGLAVGHIARHLATRVPSKGRRAPLKTSKAKTKARKMEDFDETKYAMGSLAGRQSSERDMDVEDIKGAELEGIEGEMEGPGTRNLHEPDKTFRDMLGRGRNAPPKQREEGLMIQVDKSTLTPLTKKLSNRLPVVQEDEAIVAGSVPHKCHGCGVVLQTEDANKVGFRLVV